MIDEREAPQWVGGHTLSGGEISAALIFGIVGILIPGLQPLLLGALAGEGRLTATELGYTATVELLAMGAAALLAGALLKPVGLRVIAMVACLALAAIDAATMHLRGTDLVLIRAAAGLPSGILIWITLAMIARSPTPERWAGIYLTTQTLAQFVWAAVLAATVMPRFGADGGFLSLALLCLAAMLAVIGLPRRFAPLPAHAMETSAVALPGARGWIALVAAFLYLAAIGGVWVYAEPLSRQAGHGPAVIGIAVSVSLACQVAGGALATILAGRVRWMHMLLLCGLANLGVVAGFALLPSAVLFIFLAGLFGFLWLFALPFLVPMAIEADPTRRAAVLLGGAQLLGASLGPLFVSMLVSDRDVRGSLGFGAAALSLFLAITIWLHHSRGRATPAYEIIKDPA
ncbi:MFS transporter [Sphingomonas sp. So64.6b]|uniref:MFS transporter n=1 Tax=Sphingomonas sp. So64.6b TaxID=2997354 RepID=UPI0015FFBF21|nr:MFS transporter [Sphingomonas sp. So64.6b]QNA84361.1 MFS transporter [Sphingomonas sp. So64.6b]